MSIKVEQFQDFELGDSECRYLFFGTGNRELHRGLSFEEDHQSILAQSKRTLNEITVAGRYLFDQDDSYLSVGGQGSFSLGVEQRDPTSVIEYIRSLPGSEGKTIINPTI